MAFENSGHFAGSSISQGNVYNIKGNAYYNQSATDRTNQIEQQLLSSLAFDEMPRRQEHLQSLVDDFGLTCQWILTPGKDHGFLSWYRRGSGLFWISGFAGTGKSTLMDYVGENLPSSDIFAESDEILQHFFSLAEGSTKLQHSLEGFYRSLCHQILQKNSHVLQRSVQELASLPFLRQFQGALQTARTVTWTLRSLKPLFQYLLKQSGKRFVVLVDGLDECGDDQEELVLVIRQLSASNAKVVCSSRPDEPFSSALKDTASIELQYVNAEDIRTFCNTTLQGTKAFPFVEQIVRLSQGIFLWAAVVATDLRRESRVCTNDDLRNRLEQCSPGMFNLYQHMLIRQSSSVRPGRFLAPYLLILKTFLEVGLFNNPGASGRVPLPFLFWMVVVLQDDTEYFRETPSLSWLASIQDRAEIFQAQVLSGCAGLICVVDIEDDDDSTTSSSIEEADGCHVNPQYSETSVPSRENQADVMEDRAIRSQCNLRIRQLLGTGKHHWKGLSFVHRTAVDFLCHEITKSQLSAKLSISKLEIIRAAARLLISKPEAWDETLLDFGFGVFKRLKALGHCARYLETDSSSCSDLYDLVMRLMATNSSTDVPYKLASLADLPHMVEKHRLYLNIFLEQSIYNHSLSLWENVACAWLVENLDFVAFLRYARSLGVSVDMLFAQTLIICWNDAAKLRYSDKFSELLSLQKPLTGKLSITIVPVNWSERPLSELGTQETSLWLIFMQVWTTEWFRLNQRVYSEVLPLYRRSVDWFLATNAIPAYDTQLQLNLRFSTYLYTIRLLGPSLHIWKCFITSIIDVEEERSWIYWRIETVARRSLTRSRLNQAAPPERPSVFRDTAIVFRISVMPLAILPHQFTEEFDLSKQGSGEETPPIRFTSLSVYGTKIEIPISAETSQTLCEMTGLRRYCLGHKKPFRHPGIKDDGLSKPLWDTAQLAVDILTSHEQEFEDEDKVLVCKVLNLYRRKLSNPSKSVYEDYYSSSSDD